MEREYSAREAPERSERIRPADGPASTFAPVRDPIVPVCYGDGVGPTVVPATQRVLDTAAHATGRSIHWHHLDDGDRSRERANPPLDGPTLDHVRECRVLLTGPMDPLETDQRRPIEQWLPLEFGCLTTVHEPVLPGPTGDATLDSMDRPPRVVVPTADGLAGTVETGPDSPATEAVRSIAASDVRDGVALPDDLAIGLRSVTRESTRRVVERALEYLRIRDGGRLTIVHGARSRPETDGRFRDWAVETVLAHEPDAMILADGPGGWDGGAGGRDGGAGGGDGQADPTVEVRRLNEVLESLARTPSTFDVLVSPPVDGQYLARIPAIRAGNGGHVATGFVGDGRVIVTPGHSPDPTGVGRDGTTVDPTPTILAGRLLLESLGWSDTAALVREALRATYADGIVPDDRSRAHTGSTGVSTTVFVDRVVEFLETIA